MAKRAKADVDYSMGKPTAHCGKLTENDKRACEHFIAFKVIDNGECEKVEGIIKRNYWCRLYSRAKE